MLALLPLDVRMPTPMTAVHPVTGDLLPPRTFAVPREWRDWRWDGNARRRRRLVALVLRAKGTTCHLCGQAGADSADHLVPWSHGGRNALHNLAPAHQGCNSVRQDAPLLEWFRAHPVQLPVLAPSREW